MNEITWAVREGYEETIVDSTSSNSDSSTLSEGTNEENKSTESIPLPPNMAAWIQPAPITENSFIAIPTYVDHDCFVYLHPKTNCKFQHLLFENIILFNPLWKFAF